MRNHLLCTTVTFSFIAIGAPALADDTDQGPETVVVTAARMPEPREQTGSSTSIISADDLKNEQTIVVTDILAKTPGLDVVRTGGIGQTTTISQRGAEAGQTLVLLDGMRINDPSTVDDEAVLGDLLANDIARIEVLRGPQSTLYGSDAIGGVVDIMTKRGGSSPIAITGTAEGGSFDTWHLNTAVNGTSGDLEYAAAANYFHTAGTSSADSRYVPGGPDSYGNFGATENIRLNLSDAVSIDLRSYYTSARDEFDDNYISIPTPPYFRVAESPAYGTDQLATAYAGINVDLFDGQLQNRLAAIGLESDRKTFPAPATPDNFFGRGNSGRFEYQGIFAVSSQSRITFGAEYQGTSLTTHSIFDSTPVTKGHDATTGYYVQGQSTLFDALTLTGGVRYDHDQEFGGHVSVKAAGAWSLNDGATVLRANYGDGFKAPSLYELYSEYSNPIASLRPETARGWEAGADQFFLDGDVRVALTWFERQTRDQIDFFDCFGPTSPACDQRYLVGGYYFNIGNSRARGLEGEATMTLSTTLKATLSFTDMTDIVLTSDSAAGLVAGADLAREPHIMANASLFWTPVAPLSLGASIGYVGHRWDDVGNTVPLASNTVSNLYASYAVNETLDLFARVENLFDARYEPAFGYGAPGRALFAGIRAHY